jgi:hydrogenase/urease accessory protein HupE
MISRSIVILLITIVSVVLPVTSQAHKLQPAFLELSEQSAGVYNVLWKGPLVGNKPMQIYPSLPDSCRNVTEPVHNPSASAFIERRLIDCGDGGLVGKMIEIAGLPATQTDTLLRIESTEGQVLTTVLRPDEPRYLVPEAPSKTEVAWSYLVLGVEHILGGFDHLLFVLGLLLIVRSTMLLVKTITAFTLAHSVTLGMASLGFVTVPQTPVEAVIALSILFLATELSKQQRGEIGLTARAPWLVALSFGLLHGFGFAGALTEIGLPQTDIPLALLFFNVGVEVGQLIFVAAVMAALWLLRIFTIRWPGWSYQAPAYGIGSLAAFWFIQRTMSF